MIDFEQAIRDDRISPLFAGEVTQALEEAVRRAEAAERELERWRHGVTIEGDFVCPDSLRADAAEAEVKQVRLEQARVEIRVEAESSLRAHTEAEVKRLSKIAAEALADADALRGEVTQLRREASLLRVCANNGHDDDKHPAGARCRRCAERL